MLRTLLIVALGGGIGSALRYAVSKFVQDSTNGAFPYHTFAVNIVGCLLIGLFYGLAARGHLGNNAFVALLYIASSMFCGLLAVALGYLIIDIIASGR